MAINAATVIEWRPDTGSDDNGGGWADLDPGTSVDYSQQAAAQLNNADGATSGIGVTTFTSATGGFTDAMVGSVLNIKTGTNAVTGTPFQITARTDTNTVTLDRAPDDGVGGVASADFYVGGARAIYDDTFHEALTAGNIHYIQLGTMTLGSAIDVALDGTDIAPMQHIGYKVTRGDNPTGADRPTIAAGANTFLWDEQHHWSSIIVTITADQGWRSDRYSRWYNCRCQNTSTTINREAFTVGTGTGGSRSSLFDCEGQSREGTAFAIAGLDAQFHNCWAHDSQRGIWGSTNIGGMAVRGCIASMCWTGGMRSAANQANFVGDTIYNCEDGMTFDNAATQHNTARNCIMDSCVQGGVETAARALANDQDWNNYHGNDADTDGNWTKGPNATAADPAFVGETVWTDLACASGTNVLTSVSGGFNSHFAAHSIIRIESGTNFTAGWYRVQSLDSDTQVTLTADPKTVGGSNASSGTMRACNDFRTGTNVQGTGAGMLVVTGGVGADSSVPQGAWSQIARIPGTSLNNFATGGWEPEFPSKISVSVVTYDLNSAYTYGSAGDAVAMRFALSGDKTLTDIYCYLFNLSGTPANVNDLNWEIRDNGATATMPGSVVVASGTYDPSGDSPPEWLTLASGRSDSLLKGKIYWLVVGDADGDGTDYATIIRNGPFGSALNSLLMSTNTTDGFASVLNNRDSSAMVLKFSDGSVIGNPYARVSNTAYDVERGLKVQFDSDAVLTGLRWGGAPTAGNLTGIKIYRDGVVPGGSTVYTSTEDYEDLNLHGLYTRLESDVTLTGGVVYRVVFTSGGSDNDPRQPDMGAGTIPNDVKAARYAGNSNWCFTRDDGGGGWTDVTESLMTMALVLRNMPAGGGGVVAAPNIGFDFARQR